MGDPEDRVTARAREIWEAEGRPEGRDLDHWLQAERETAQDLTPVDGPVEENSAEAGIEHVIEQEEEVDTSIPGAATLANPD